MSYCKVVDGGMSYCRIVYGGLLSVGLPVLVVSQLRRQRAAPDGWRCCLDPGRKKNGFLQKYSNPRLGGINITHSSIQQQLNITNAKNKRKEKKQFSLFSTKILKHYVAQKDSRTSGEGLREKLKVRFDPILKKCSSYLKCNR